MLKAFLFIFKVTIKVTNPIIMPINWSNFYRISVTLAYKILKTQVRCNVVKNYGRYDRFII